MCIGSDTGTNVAFSVSGRIGSTFRFGAESKNFAEAIMMAHAMLVTIDGALGPFSIDDRFLVTEVDEMQNPLKTRLEVTLGR